MVRDIPWKGDSEPTGRRLIRTPYVLDREPPGWWRRWVLRFPNTMLVVGLVAAAFSVVVFAALVLGGFAVLMALLWYGASGALPFGTAPVLSGRGYVAVVSAVAACGALAWLCSGFVLAAFSSERQDSTWRDDLVGGLFSSGAMVVVTTGLFLEALLGLWFIVAALFG